MKITHHKIPVSKEIGTRSAILTKPDNPAFLLVLAHGAGAGMTHPFMETLTRDLAETGIATFRFNFPYMEQGKRRPDSPKVAHQAIAEAVEKAKELSPGIPIFAGGKSFGGRMTSQLAASGGLSDAKGLVFFGFPFHAPGKPGTARAAHLKEVIQPMLFLQGTRDTLAQIPVIRSVCEDLPGATLSVFEGADHSFKMLKRSGLSQEGVIRKLAKTTKEWTEKNLEVR